MDKKEIKRIADIIYNTYMLEGWKNVSMKDCTEQAVCYLEAQAEQLILSDVVSSCACDKPTLGKNTWTCGCGNPFNKVK